MIRITIGLLIVTSVSGFVLLDRENGGRSAAAAPLHIDSLPSPAAPGSAEPNLAVGAAGRVYMTWFEPAETGYALRFATLTGGTWSTPTTIRSGTDFWVNWADFPSIEVIGGKRLAVHWLQRTGKGTYAYGVRISQSADDGKTWSDPVVPHRDTAQQEHGFVAMWPQSGKIAAVWLDGRNFKSASHDASNSGDHSAGNEMMLMSTTISPDGSLGKETLLDNRVCDCCQNAAAVTSRGPIVAYRNRTADEIRDIYVTRQVNGKWTAGAPIHDDGWKIAACPVNGPALAASGNRVAAAWFTGANDTARVKVAFSTDGGARFGTPIRVDGGRPGGRVDLVLLPDGSAIVSWIERTGGDTAAVLARQVTAKGLVSDPRTVATSSSTRASGVPRMILAGSHVVFAWTVPTKPSAVRVARAAIQEFK